VIAVAIAGSQKTLPIGLLIATHPDVAAVSGPFVTFPLLAFHAAQLLLDAAVADWWATSNPTAASPPV
jgi:predicted Na+-dependent transporter